MSTTSPRHEQDARRRLLLKRFAMASAIYAMTFLLILVAAAIGHYQAPIHMIPISGALIVASQLGFLLLFRSGRNLKAKDPCRTEVQVLVGLAWLTYFLVDLSLEAQATLLVFYVLIPLFGILQLRPWAFVRCCGYAFLCFSLLVLWETSRGEPVPPGPVILQLLTLVGALLWLCLFRRHIQATYQRMRQKRNDLLAHQNTLRGMMRQLEDLASTDELTGLYNRRYFMRLAETELANLSPDRQLGLALIDLDHFKRINDLHGHAAGDRVLQTFAAVAKACLREGDVLARYGGEEFVLLLLNVDIDQIAVCCERLREAFAVASPVGMRLSDLSLSIGMTLLQDGDTLQLALERADQALYRAKRNGRNRCEASWESAGV